jgi:hypothetical protein
MILGAAKGLLARGETEGATVAGHYVQIEAEASGRGRRVTGRVLSSVFLKRHFIENKKLAKIFA